ncbi:MAG: hydroxymethylglutaryl-CoA lyase [Oceanospirillaceae bacterium]|nr:hydroxymethylglutaryl-CoA lyase [Oceanospirillaceae bacterium]
METEVTLIEVAPRDGFQSVKEMITTSDKLAIIAALARAGLQHIEVGSFVSPKAIAQMADIAPVLQGVAQLPQSFECIVLVPNRRGAQLATEHVCQRLNFVFSASETHNLNNVNKTLSQSLAELRQVQSVVERSERLSLRVSLATSFDCPFSGKVNAQHTLALFQQVLDISPDAQLALCDTTGRAHPFAVRSLFERALALIAKPEQLIFHCHDTYGLAIANVAAAFEVGVRSFDTAVAGFGGCPFAPGASGNVATEDVVYFFESAGISTGVDSEKLKEAIALAEQIKGAQLGGSIRLLNRSKREASADA